MITRHEANGSKENSPEHCYVTFYISGDEVVPSEWTGYFGVAPDWTIVRGEHFFIPSGRLSRTVGQIGLWGITSKKQVDSEILNRHLQYLFNILGFPRRDFREKLDARCAKMRFLCYWEEYEKHREPAIDFDLERQVKALGGEIEVDRYPKQFKTGKP